MKMRAATALRNPSIIKDIVCIGVHGWATWFIVKLHSADAYVLWTCWCTVCANKLHLIIEVCEIISGIGSLQWGVGYDLCWRHLHDENVTVIQFLVLDGLAPITPLDHGFADLLCKNTHQCGGAWSL